MELKKATRKQVKLRLNISAPSGAGKTFSALRMAKGLCGSWDKIAVVDTENGSASLYSHLGDFNVIDLTAPFTPEKYIEAIELCVSAGMEVIILDSTTHEWSCLRDENELLAASKFKGNTWSAWSVTTPRHDRFLNAVLQCKAHIITCTRSKTETALVEYNGRKEVKKIGLKDEQREGWEYELTVSLNLERDTHFASPSKDRTNLFEGKNPFLITEDTGKQIAEWCDLGIEVPIDIIPKDQAPVPETKTELPAITEKMFGQLITRLKFGEDDVITKAKEKYRFSLEKGQIVNSIMKAKKPNGKWEGEVEDMKEASFRDFVKLMRVQGEGIVAPTKIFFKFSDQQEDYLKKVIASINKKAA